MIHEISDNENGRSVWPILSGHGVIFSEFENIPYFKHTFHVWQQVSHRQHWTFEYFNIKKTSYTTVYLFILQYIFKWKSGNVGQFINSSNGRDRSLKPAADEKTIQKYLWMIQFDSATWINGSNSQSLQRLVQGALLV